MSDTTMQDELKAAQDKIATLEAKLAERDSYVGSALQEIIFENAPGGMAIVTLNGDVVVCNTVAAKILGMSPAELTGVNTKQLYVNPEDKQRLRSILANGDTVKNYETQINHKSSSPIWVSISARPFTYNDTMSALISFVDISFQKRVQAELKEAQENLENMVRERTAKLEKANNDLAVMNLKLVKQDRDRKHAQEALEESESRFRALFENTHTVMLLLDPNDGLIIDANPAAVSFYGHTLDTLKSLLVSDINTLTQEEVQIEINKAKAEERNHFIFKHQLASGVIRDVEIFSGPVIVKGKQLLFSIIHDITDRKQAEETMLRYERVIMSTPDLISLVDKDYYYRMVNDAYLKTFGKQREDIVDKASADLLGKEFFETASKPNLDRAFAGETVRIENTIELEGRGPVHFSVTYHPVRNLAGEIDYVSIDARDVTELKQKAEALRKYSDRLDLATDAGSIGIWEWDITTNDLIWDKMMLDLYKVGPSEFSGMYDAWRTRVHPEDLPHAESELTKAMEEGKTYESEFRIVWPDGQIRHIKTAALTQCDDKGKPHVMTGVSQDITTQRTLEDDLRKLATTDPLTGASNRRSFMERAAAEFDRSRRYETPTTLLSLDIDHFKKINDTHGHMLGDVVLQSLVTTCKETLRTSDIFARMGGEEFSAVLPQTDIEAAQQTAERIRKEVEATCIDPDGEKICYTISIGLAEFRDEDESIENAMRRADDALYTAKEAGRNRVEIT